MADRTATLVDLLKAAEPDEDELGFEDAPEPGDADEIVVQPTKELPVASQVSEMTGAGWVTIYERLTGEPRQVNRWNLADAMKKLYNSVSAPANPEVWGMTVFTKRPHTVYRLGQYKCLLHPQHPDRAKIAHLGLPSCPAEHLASDTMVLHHMAAKHKAELRMINEDTSRKREDEALELQRASLQAFQEMSTSLRAQRRQSAPPTKRQKRTAVVLPEPTEV